MEISRKLVFARKTAGKTESQVYLKAGIKRDRYLDYESGKAKPTVSSLLRISDAIGVNTSYFLCDDVDSFMYCNELYSAAS